MKEIEIICTYEGGLYHASIHPLCRASADTPDKCLGELYHKLTRLRNEVEACRTAVKAMVEPVFENKDEE